MKEIDVFYNTFNARHLNPREVADSFIWSDSYGKLIQNNHSVVLGARGCGKTTLMKMLTLPALYSWKDEMANRIRKDIGFYSIYISTDIYWDVKNQTYSSQLEKFGDFSRIVSEFAVNSNVFKAVCETFKHVITFELNDLDEKKEYQLCKNLIHAWKLKSTIPKLDYVIDALNLRIDTVNQSIQKLIFNYRSDDDIPKNDFFYLGFESSLEYVIPIFERIYNIGGVRKWALCFDELEFAPIWLQQKLFISLRSRTQYLLYKLSASPILSGDLEKNLLKEYSATPGNDLQIIKMWRSSENEEFSFKIIESLLKKKLPDLSPIEFFGSNSIYNKGPNSYDRGSEFYGQEVKLLEKDDSFRQFLEQYGIDPANPLPTTDNQKDTLFRKIKPIVYFRNFYVEVNKVVDGVIRHSLRGRKTGDLYFGVEVLKKVCDGNPRWLISLVTAILSKSAHGRVDKRIQYQELLAASRRFSNMMENIPIGSSSTFTFKTLLAQIGSYFSGEVLGPSFFMEPKTTFTVDLDSSIASRHILEIIEKGVSQGAFILLDSEDDNFDFEVRNQRFKLSYLLSIQYKLPLRKNPVASLSEILYGKDDIDSKSKSNSQLEIF